MPGNLIKFFFERNKNALWIEPKANFLCNLNFKKLALLAFRFRTLNKKQSPNLAINFPLKTFIQIPLTVEVLSTIATRLRKISNKKIKKKNKKK